MLTEHMLKEIEEYANKPEIKSLPLRRRKSSIYAYAQKQGYLADNESTDPDYYLDVGAISELLTQQ